jgi:hypothetical protein
MWWDSQNLDAPRRDKKGRRWNFRVWHDVFTVDRTLSVARVFFWDEDRNSTGVVLLAPDANKHIRDLRGLIDKLLASEELRAAHSRELRFPFERFYAEYGAFPDEQEVLTKLRSRV